MTKPIKIEVGECDNFWAWNALNSYWDSPYPEENVMKYRKES